MGDSRGHRGGSDPRNLRFGAGRLKHRSLEIRAPMPIDPGTLSGLEMPGYEAGAERRGEGFGAAVSDHFQRCSDAQFPQTGGCAAALTCRDTGRSRIWKDAE